MRDYQTDQESFWAGDFGSADIARNNSDALFKSKVAPWSKMLRAASGVSRVLELGCNIGLTLVALQRLRPAIRTCGYEINAVAADQARQNTNGQISCGSILETLGCGTFDLTLAAGGLNFITPGFLESVSANFYNHRHRYVLVAEDFNPSPVAVKYRGTDDRLFKREPAGDLIEKCDMKLLDFGFA